MKVTVLENGPIIIDQGDEGKVAICRCGNSSNQPFCTGTHREVGFEAPAAEYEDTEDCCADGRCSC